MVYCCADLHGDYETFIKLLKAIHFTEKDEMIICGDAIDKGINSVKLLKFISSYENFTFILGNHEYDFLKYYHELMQDEDCDYDKVLDKVDTYFSEDEQVDWELLDWLEERPFYVERDGFVCVHSGIPINYEDHTLQDLSTVIPEQFVYDRWFADPKELPVTDKCIFFGHTPTYNITGEYDILTYKKTDTPKTIKDFTKIHLDIGGWLGGGLACFCVDTLTEYYVRQDGKAYKRENLL